MAARTTAAPLYLEEDVMPVPTDPRSPQQRIADQLAAANRQLIQHELSRSQRRAIADRIHELNEQARRLAARFTLTYTTAGGPVTKVGLPAHRVERIGTLAARGADRGEVWDIKVRDEDGGDVTCDFACFAE
ncbi:hypothetical protein [Streptomyces sp. H23]|uniref:hypothetical protein n=1 Tax=Streptomyces sp. H23 TaxID=2541723 RepID=UPI00106EA251|nr:hypothetical protein [Streptomyces sp. H23]